MKPEKVCGVSQLDFLGEKEVKKEVVFLINYLNTFHAINAVLAL